MGGPRILEPVSEGCDPRALALLRGDARQGEEESRGHIHQEEALGPRKEPHSCCPDSGPFLLPRHLLPP